MRACCCTPLEQRHSAVRSDRIFLPLLGPRAPACHVTQSYPQEGMGSHSYLQRAQHGTAQCGQVKYQLQFLQHAQHSTLDVIQLSTRHAAQPQYQRHATAALW